ncbi:asparaginase, partial [Enterococcus lactis]
GFVPKIRILFLQDLLETKRLDISAVNGTFPIVKAYAGMQGDLLEAIAHTKVDGLVIDALGAGNLRPHGLAALEKVLV